MFFVFLGGVYVFFFFGGGEASLSKYKLPNNSFFKEGLSSLRPWVFTLGTVGR